MSYVRVNWENSPSTNTPRNADNLNIMDAGIEYNDQRLNGTKPIENTIYATDFKCKNLFNGIYQSVTGLGINDEGYFSRSDQLLYVIPIEQDTKTYTFSFESTVSSGYFALTNEIPTSTSSTHGTRTLYNLSDDRFVGTYTNSNYKYLLIGLQVNKGATNIQIEIGSEATSFTEYKEFENSTAGITIGGLSSAHTTTTTSEEKLELNSVISNKNSKLSLNNGGVKIGKNIDYVVVSGQVRYSSVPAVGNRIGAIIYKNNNFVAQAIFRATNASNTDMYISVSPVIIQVTEGDIIYLYCKDQDGIGAVISNSSASTYLTVIQV